MILTHWLACFGLPPLLVQPDAALLRLASVDALIGGGRVDPALLPRLRPRAADTTLRVRGD
jgi:hypothetical protein